MTPTHDYVYDAAMHRIIDGDTYDLRIDLGFGIFATITVRLHGYNTPELGTMAGDAAAEFVRSLLPPTTPLKVQTYKGPQSGKDKHSFARWVADVWVWTPYFQEGQEPILLGELLVARKFAVAR